MTKATTRAMTRATTRAMTRATTRATAKVVMADGRLGAVETRELCRWRIRMNSVNQICMLKLRNIRAAWTCHFPICCARAATKTGVGELWQGT